MNDSFFMRVGDGFAHLFRQFQNALRVHGTLPKDLRNPRATDIFHCQIEPTILCFTIVVECDDVGVVQLCEGLGFQCKAIFEGLGIFSVGGWTQYF